MNYLSWPGLSAQLIEKKHILCNIATGTFHLNQKRENLHSKLNIQQKQENSDEDYCPS